MGLNQPQDVKTTTRHPRGSGGRLSVQEPMDSRFRGNDVTVDGVIMSCGPPMEMNVAVILSEAKDLQLRSKKELMQILRPVYPERSERAQNDKLSKELLMHRPRNTSYISFHCRRGRDHSAPGASAVPLPVHAAGSSASR